MAAEEKAMQRCPEEPFRYCDTIVQFEVEGVGRFTRSDLNV
jgi:hypothetical protein